YGLMAAIDRYDLPDGKLSFCLDGPSRNRECARRLRVIILETLNHPLDHRILDQFDVANLACQLSRVAVLRVCHLRTSRTNHRVSSRNLWTCTGSANRWLRVTMRTKPLD